MADWWTKHDWKVLVPLAVIAWAGTFMAFWFGGASGPIAFSIANVAVWAIFQIAIFINLSIR